MHKLVAVFAAVILLPACSGGAGSSSSLPPAPGIAAAAASSQPLSISGARRLPQDGFGGVFGFLIGDAPPRIAQGNGYLYPLQINVAITEIDVTRSDGMTVQVLTFSPAQIVNLLDYKTSLFNLGSGRVPVGQYTSVTLVLDIALCGVSFGGSKNPMNFQAPSKSATAPSANASTPLGSNLVAVKIPVSATVNGINPTQISMDFNVGEAVSLSSTGFMMTPVVFAAPAGSAAAASGTVTNKKGKPIDGATVVAYQTGTWTVANTGTTDSNGAFTLKNLAAGTYNLYVYNHYTTAAGQGNDGHGQSQDDPSKGGIAGPQVTINGSNVAGINITD